jgi:uncharacterized protein
MAVAVRPMTAGDRASVLAINAQGSPHVTKLDEPEIVRLIDMGARVLLAEGTEGDVVAYLITFARTCRYDGEEFLALRQAIPDDFLYVDQVAVAPSFQGRGVGRALYLAAGETARAQGRAWLCCEVNEQPPNPGSMLFHSAMGFAKIGSMATRDGRTVALLARRL